MKFTNSIKKRGTIKYILNNCKYNSSKNITIYVQNNYKKENFIAICVSKKNGGSVARNKLKRWIREIYKYEEFKTKKGLNIIFLLKKNTTIENITYELIYSQIKEAFREIDIYE